MAVVWMPPLNVASPVNVDDPATLRLPPSLIFPLASIVVWPLLPQFVTPLRLVGPVTTSFVKDVLPVRTPSTYALLAASVGLTGVPTPLTTLPPKLMVAPVPATSAAFPDGSDVRAIVLGDVPTVMLLVPGPPAVQSEALLALKTSPLL